MKHITAYLKYAAVILAFLYLSAFIVPFEQVFTPLNLFIWLVVVPGMWYTHERFGWFDGDPRSVEPTRLWIHHNEPRP